MEKDFKKVRILLYISVGVIIGIFVLSGSFALWEYTSEKNASLNTITYGLDYYINYAKGTNLTSSTLDPGTTYTSGNNATIELWKKDNTYDIYGHIYLDINTISSNLRSLLALKYAVVSNNKIISSGSLKGVSQGDSILLKGDIPLVTTKQLYAVYIWLDSSTELDDTLEGESLSVSIRAEATMKKLGLENYNGASA